MKALTLLKSFFFHTFGLEQTRNLKCSAVVFFLMCIYVYIIATCNMQLAKTGFLNSKAQNLRNLPSKQIAFHHNAK